MLIAIIADIHDNLPNLEKCLNYLRQNKITKIICLGDITNQNTLNHLARHFSGEIFVVRGNADNYVPSDIIKHKQIKDHQELGIIKIGGLQIGFGHKPETIKKILKKATQDLDFIFYGHNHKPWIEQLGQTLIANPGTLAGLFQEATMAILNSHTKKLELKLIANF